MKPFLKWAGGKRQLLPALVRYIPPEYGRYIEPFVGGGALFFHLLPKHAVISDSNPELTNTYIVVRDQVDDLITLLSGYPYNKDFYYALRQRQPETLTDVERAARFIYLNRTCFNGLYRVNKKGQFNVPFGDYKNPTICDVDALKRASAALARVEILTGDYQTTLDNCVNLGDFVFLDPPYHPVSVYSDFKRYTKDFFYEDDQKRLAQRFKQLSEAGVYAVLTNSTALLILELYSEFETEIVSANRNINSNASKRTQSEEVIVISHPLAKRLHGKLENVKQLPLDLDLYAEPDSGSSE